MTDAAKTQLQRHIMIDLETLGTSENAHILSIGMVAFDRDEIVKTLYLNVSPDGQEHRHVDGNTARWWMTQSDAARAALNEPGPMRAYRVAQEVAIFIAGMQTDAIWAYPASFDLPILHSFLRQFGEHKCMDRRKQRCARTTLALADVSIDSYRAAGTHHNALDDATAQVAALREALRVLAFNWEKQ